jgi:hypothetical protein
VASVGLRASAATVSWLNDAGGAWFTASNWSSNPLLPQSGDDVVIDRPSADPSVLFSGTSSTTVNIKSLVLADSLQIASGNLNVADGISLSGVLRLGDSDLFTPVINASGTGHVALSFGRAGIRDAQVNSNIQISGSSSFLTLVNSRVNGTITGNGAHLGFYRSSFSISDLGTLNLQSCTVELGGALANAGNTILLDNPTNRWAILGNSTVNGGTIAGLNGATILFSNVTLGDVVLGINAEVRDGGLRVSRALTLNNATIDLTGINHTGLMMDPASATHEIRGTGRIRMRGNGSSMIGISGAPNPIIVGPGITIGGSGRIETNGQRIVNKGTLIADDPAQSLLVLANGSVPIRNEGVIRSTNNATMALHMNAGFEQAGEILVESGRIFAVGFIDQAHLGTARNIGGELIIGGGINNTGKSISLSDQTGTWTLSDANITGGSLSATGSARFFMQGGEVAGANVHALSGGVHVDAPITLRGGGLLTVNDPLAADNQLVLEGRSGGTVAAKVVFNGQQTLNTGPILFDVGGGVVPGSVVEGGAGGGTLTLGANMTIATRTGDGVLRGRFENHGTVTAKGFARRLTMEGELFNHGTISATDSGTLRLLGTVTTSTPVQVGASSVLEGTGRIVGDVNSAGIIAAGIGSPARAGTLLIEGDVMQPVSGVISLVVDSDLHAPASRLEIDGDIVAAGLLLVTRRGTAAFRFNDQFDLLDFESFTGQFSSITLPVLPPQYWWVTDELYSAGTIRVVPEPGFVVVALGLFLCRRRQLL